MNTLITFDVTVDFGSMALTIDAANKREAIQKAIEEVKAQIADGWRPEIDRAFAEVAEADEDE